MVLTAIALLGLLTTGGDAELRVAGYEFVLPSGFEYRRPTSPALVYFVARRLATDVARGRIFVVPVEPDADIELAAVRTQTVSGLIDPAFTLAGKPVGTGADERMIEETNPLGKGRQILVVRPLDGRFLALMYFDDGSEDAPAADSVLAAFRAMSTAQQEYPQDSAETLLHQPLGLKVVLPFAYEAKEPGGEIGFTNPLTFTPPIYFGLISRLEVLAVRDGLDRSLADAAAEARDSALAATNDTTLTRFEELKATAACEAAFRITCTRGNDTIDTALLDANRRRYLFTHRFKTQNVARFANSLDRVIASLRFDTPRTVPDLGLKRIDKESGFSIRPPPSYTIVKGGPGLVVYREAGTRPPTTEIRVMLAEEDVIPPDDADTVLTRATKRSAAQLALAGEPWRLAAAPSTRVYAGTRAAHYALEDPTSKPPLRDERVLFFAPDRTFEVAIVAVASEFEKSRAVFDAVIGSFRPEQRQVELILGEPVTSQDGRLSIAPPEEWRSTAPAANTGAALRFVPADGEPNIELIAGSAVLSPAAPLVGLAERYRAQIEAELAASGATTVRVEETKATRLAPNEWWYRVAYQQGDLPMRELRRARLKEESVQFAAARIPASRFHLWSPLLSKSLESFTVEEAP